VYRVLAEKPERRRPVGRPRRRWEDNIRMDLWEVGCGCVDWMELAQGRDRWRELEHLHTPQSVGLLRTSDQPVAETST
jgi:hypothetical protein